MFKFNLNSYRVLFCHCFACLCTFVHLYIFLLISLIRKCFRRNSKYIHPRFSHNMFPVPIEFLQVMSLEKTFFFLAPLHIQISILSRVGEYISYSTSHVPDQDEFYTICRIQSGFDEYSGRVNPNCRSSSKKL